MTETVIRALFECPCGNRVFWPRNREGAPECLTCHEMEFVEDVEREIRSSE